MTRLTAKVEIQPTKPQLQACKRAARCARWAYNWGLAESNKDYQAWAKLGKPKKWSGWRSQYDLRKELKESACQASV